MSDRFQHRKNLDISVPLADRIAPLERNVWIVPDQFERQFKSLAEEKGKELRVWQGLELSSREADSLLFLMPRSEVSHSRLASIAQSISISWGVITWSVDEQDPVGFVQERLATGHSHPTSESMLAVFDNGVILVDLGDGNLQSIDPASTDVPYLISSRQWGLCVLSGHGENGHMKIGDLVFCPAPKNSQLVSDDSRDKCVPGEYCRRAGDYKVISMASVRSNILATLACGVWSTGTELYPTDYSSVARVEQSSTSAWITTWAPKVMASFVEYGLIDLIRGGLELGTCVEVLNDIHCRGFGVRPFALWGDPLATHSGSPQAAQWFPSDPLSDCEVIGKSEDGGAVVRGKKGLLLISASDEVEIFDRSEKFSWAKNEIARAVDTCARLRVYQASSIWNQSEGSESAKVELEEKCIGLEHRISELALLRHKVEIDGVISEQQARRFHEIEPAINQLDDILAGLVLDIPIDLQWGLVKAGNVGRFSVVPRGLCPFDHDHPSTSEQLTTPQGNLTFLRCSICGPLRLGYDHLVPRINTSKWISLGSPLEVGLEWPETKPSGCWILTARFHDDARSRFFTSTRRRELTTELHTIPIPGDLTPEAHHLVVHTIENGAIAWSGRRIVPRDSMSGPSSQEARL